MRAQVAAALAAIALISAPLSQALASAATQAPDPSVLMSPVALPVVADGRVVNYIFVTLRLNLTRDADSAKLRSLEPFFRDALVRAGHRAPFVRPDTYIALDDARLKQTVLNAALAIVGPGQVVSVQVVREQPQHLDGLPKPGAAPSAD